MDINTNNKNKGVIILIAFILLAVLASFSVVFIYIVQTNIGSVKNWALYQQARFLSESGIHLAIASIVHKLQNNPYVIDESDLFTKGFEIDYNKIFNRRGEQIINSSLVKHTQKLFGQEHEFALLNKVRDKFSGIKIFIKDASGKVNAKNTDSQSFKYFMENLSTAININFDIDFSLLYTEKFPVQLRKYFSLYPLTYELLKYSSSEKGLDEYEKFKKYFQERFEFESRSLLNLNTVTEDVIVHNLSGSSAVYLQNYSCGSQGAKGSNKNIQLNEILHSNKNVFDTIISINPGAKKHLCIQQMTKPKKETIKTTITAEKARQIAQFLVQKRKVLNGWKNYKELFLSLREGMKSILTNDEIELLIALIHPKIILSQLHNYKHTNRTIDKTNIIRGGFEFSLTSDGYYEIYSIGIVFKENELLAQETTFKLVKLFSKKILFSYNDFKNNIVMYDGIGFYPYNPFNLPVNAQNLDGFLSLSRVYDFCKNEEGQIFKYTFDKDDELTKVGFYDLVQGISIINPNQLKLFLINEGLYLPPYFSLLTNIDKTMELKILDKQEGSTPLCSPFLSVKPYLYLLNNFGINLIFKNLKEQGYLSYDFLNKKLDLLDQLLNVTIHNNTTQIWSMDYPLTIDIIDEKLKEKIQPYSWNILSFYYYYKINQGLIARPTEEKFNMYLRLNNQIFITIPDKEKLYINTVFFENLFKDESILAIGGLLYPQIYGGVLLTGMCFYRTLNFLENFLPLYKKNGFINLITPRTKNKIITNMYYFGDKIVVDNLNKLNTIKVSFNFTTEDELPILDIIEYLIFEKVEFIESY